MFLPAAKYIKMFVLDEADEMLSRGFKDQIYEIFQKLGTSTQVRTLRFLLVHIISVGRFRWIKSCDTSEMFAF